MFGNLFNKKAKQNDKLRDAASSGDLNLVEELLKQGADSNDLGENNGESALNLAIFKKHPRIATALIKSGANVNFISKGGNSPLFLVASHGDALLETASELLAAGAKVDLCPAAGDNAGATPLYVAVTRGGVELCNLLLNSGASEKVSSVDGGTIMHASAQGNSPQLIERFYQMGISLDAKRKDGATSLYIASILGHSDVMKVLAKLGAKIDLPNNEGITPLMRAASGGYRDCVDVLVDAGAQMDIKLDGAGTAAEIAKAAGHDEISKKLSAIQKSQKAAVKGEKDRKKLRTDLFDAINEMDIAKLRKSIASKEFPNIELDVQLFVQTMLGGTDDALRLLKAGANPDFKMDNLMEGCTPVMLAASLSKDVKLVKALLDAGANPDIVTPYGDTALQLASKANKLEIVNLLLSKKANPNLANVNGLTPLIAAAMEGHKDVVSALVKSGVEINAVLKKNKIGAFGAALDKSHTDVALYLLECGAEPNYGDGNTLPLAAIEWGSLELLKAIDVKGGVVVPSDMKGRAAIVAARNRDWRVLDFVFEHGADLDDDEDIGKLKYTPLILATLGHHPELVEHYLVRGDDPSERDVDQETALSLAIEKEYQDIVDILRRHKAEVKEYLGLSDAQSMLKAAEDGALGTILDLRDAGNSLNVEDEYGNTPVILATKAGHIGVVRTLFHLGADINHRNHNGESATNVANGNEVMLQTLREFVADDAIALVMPEGLKKIPLGGFYSAGDMFFGRLSHPFKDRPPYVDDEESMSDDADNESERYAEILALMDHLESLLKNENVRAKMPEEHIDHFTKAIVEIRESEPSEIPDDIVEQLQGVAETLNSYTQQTDEQQEIAPIFYACAEGDIAQLKKFAKSGGDINSALPNGKTLLMLATEHEQEKIIDELIKLGADVNATSNESFSALLLSCFIGNISIFSKLIKAGADINKYYEIATGDGNKVTNCTALYIAAQVGQLEICRALIKSGAEIDAMNSMGYTPFMTAIKSGNGDLARLFLKSGANPDPEIVLSGEMDGVVSFTPLTLAATNELPEIVSELLKCKIDINRPTGDGWTALKYAAKAGDLDMVKQLVKAGADVDQADNEGWTPLMNASNEGYDDAIKLLIKSGAEVNARAKDGRTALSFAEENDCRSSIKILLAAGADSKLAESEMPQQLDELASDEDMGVGLIVAVPLAIKSGNFSLVKLMLAGGVDVNQFDDDGNSALKLAIAALFAESLSRKQLRNAEEMIDLLVRSGANPKLIPSKGPSVMDLVNKLGRRHLINRVARLD